MTSNQAIAFTKPDTDIYNEKYLFYYLLRERGNFNTLGIGNTQKNISQSIIKDYPFPVAPKKEQDLIVEKIEELFSKLDSAVSALKRVQANLKRYKASVLKAACEGRLVTTEAELARREGRAYESGADLLRRILAERRAKWEAEQRKKGKDPSKLKYEEPKGPETDGLPDLPEGWVWATVEQMAAHEANSITDGPFGSNLKTEHYTSFGPRVIRLQNIGEGAFTDSKAYISNEHFEFLRKHRIFAGDIVIAALGEKLPRACIIPDYVGPAIVKADCIRFKPHISLNSIYLNSVLNSEPVRKFASDIVHGVGRPRLNQQEIKSLAIPLPPGKEQIRIADAVESKMTLVQNIQISIEENLLRADRLRQSILKQAFEGRLVSPEGVHPPYPEIFRQERLFPGG